MGDKYSMVCIHLFSPLGVVFFLKLLVICYISEPMILLESKKYLRTMLCSLPILVSLHPALCSLGSYLSASPWDLAVLLNLLRNRNQFNCVSVVLSPHSINVNLPCDIV